MVLSKSFPAGVPIPQKVSCPEEAVPVEREGRKAIVRPTRRSSQTMLLRQGWKEVPELDPSLLGEVGPGETLEGYEEAKARGEITETGTDPASTVGRAEVEVEVEDPDGEAEPPTSEEPKAQKAPQE